MVAKWAEEAARQPEDAKQTERSGRKKRSDRQQAKERYAKSRERAQLLGVIPTVPEGAVRDEVVKPSSQGEQDTTAIDRGAISQGWRVPEEQKPKVIQRLLEKLDDPEITPAAAALVAGALVKADQIQHERDNPEVAKGKTGVTVNNVLHVDVGEILKRVRAQRAAKVIDVTPTKVVDASSS